MSNRRRPKGNPWQPWTPDDGKAGRSAGERVVRSEQDNGRTRIDAYGADAGMLACCESFRKAGARLIQFGFDAPPGYDGEDVPPGVEVTWWWRVDFGAGVVEGRSKPTTDHGRGVLEAAAQILRAGGATVTPGAN